jgi:hypothetical protein
MKTVSKGELWKTIPGYLGYEISNFGRVRSIDREITGKDSKTKKFPGKILSIHKLSKAPHYAIVFLWKNNSRKTCIVHRLVAKAFVRKYHKKHTDVLHKDDDPDNNHYKNLKWGTHQDNMTDRNTKGRQTKGEDSPNAKLTEANVRRIRELYLKGSTQNVLAEKFGVSDMTVSSIVRRKAWKHVGE